MPHPLDKVDKLAAELKPLLPMSAENQQRLNKKFRLEFSYNSNHLEGNTLTYGETELLLIFDDTKGNHTMREYEEMKAHDVAFRLLEKWAKEKDRPLTEQMIKNLNEIILVRPFWKDAITPDGRSTRRQIQVGNYKQHPNSVRLPNGEIFHYASPGETPIQMQELIDWYRNEEKAIHPVTLAAMLHYKFVRIHPFDDGNGRVSRLLMNYALLKVDLPPVIIKSSDKNNYLNALHLADIGDYAPFIGYIAEQVIWSLDISVKAAKGESIEETDDFSKELILLEKKLLQKNNVVTFSTDVFWDVLEYFYYPLVQQITKDLNNADRFFSMRTSSNLISKQEQASGGLHINSVQRNTDDPQIRDFVGNAKSMWFQYKLESPKNPQIKTPSWEYTLGIMFQETKYRILSPELTKEFSYREYPSEEDKTMISSGIKASLLDALSNGI